MSDPLYGDALMRRMLDGLSEDNPSRCLGSDVDQALDRLDAREMSHALFTEWMNDADAREKHVGTGGEGAAMMMGVGSGALKIVDVRDPLREFWAVYTNGIRGELRDMFTILMSLKVRGLYARLTEFQDEFRKWWEFFSRFLMGVLFGIEECVLGMGKRLNGDKDLVGWKEYRGDVGKIMEDVRDFCSEVDNVFLVLREKRYGDEECIKMIPMLYQKAEQLTGPLLEMLESLDDGLERFVRGSQVPARSLLQMHRAAINSMMEESGLGWSVLVALTGWMPSREMRRDFVGLHVRGVKRLGFMKATNNVHNKHYAIVDGFRQRALEFDY